MNETAVIPYNDLKAMAQAIAQSNLFGLKSETQVLALMAVAQAEGKHPAIVARDYDIIQGRPAKKAEAMLRDFLAGGGKVVWGELTDKRCEATFSHPQGGTATIDWDMARANQAQLKNKDMYTKYPRQMLRARVVSEGVRTVWPLATSGSYVPEEVADFSPRGSVDPRPDDMKPMDLDKRNTILQAMKELLDVDQSKLSKPEAAAHCIKIRDIWDLLTHDEMIQVHDGFNTRQKGRLKVISGFDIDMLKREASVVEQAQEELIP